MHVIRLSCCAFLALALLSAASTTARAGEPGLVVVEDAVHLARPRDVILEWYLQQRLDANLKGRLLKVDLEERLDGFRHRPGKHPWIGEHIGKWLHAASLAWDYSGDSELKKKLDYAVTELLKTQEADGYLGTYEPSKRFGLYRGADWDVWVHKYCLIGLLAYRQYVGGDKPLGKAALDGARKAADLLVATFGPGKKDIIEAGTHVGMAATSVLEPVVRLYRATGEKKYLEFAKYIVSAYDHPKGPRIISSLLASGNVRKTANAKAYEMLSNLVGLCELYRVTGTKTYLEVCEKAWQDIVRHRMYITGGVSLREHFQDDGVLPNTGAVAETCADVTWEQLNVQLLRITGKARYADLLERLVFNHLLAAQKPDGSAICYFTPLEGKKNYKAGTNCCSSSGPRGVALIPTFVFTARKDSLDVDIFGRGEAEFTLADGKTYRIEQRSRFPAGNKLFVRVLCEDFGPPAKYRLRVPSWATPSGRIEDARWQEYSEEVRLVLDFTPRVIVGTGGNEGKAAVMRGPIVYCLEERFNPGLVDTAALAAATREGLGLEAFGAKEKAIYKGQALLRAKGVRLGPDGKPAEGGNVSLVLSDYANAGADGGKVKVWIPLAP